MQDNQIVALYWDRNEAAIEQTDKKYGRYLTKIAYNILADREDSQESVNDTYLEFHTASQAGCAEHILRQADPADQH